MSLKLSVVIPSLEFGSRQQELVRSCFEQNMSSSQFEVILVVPEQSKNFENLKTNTALLRVLTIPENNVSNARNKGIAASSGKFILLIDDDVVLPSANYFLNILKLAESFKIPFVVGGAYLNPEKINPVAAAANTLANLWIQSGLRSTDHSDFATEARFLPGGALLASKDVFTYALFPTEIPWGGEDSVFIKRVQNSGNKTFYSSAMDVVHKGNSSLWKFIRRSWFSGRAQTLYGIETEKSAKKVRLLTEQTSLKNFNQFHLLGLHFAVLMAAKQFYKLRRRNPNSNQ